MHTIPSAQMFAAPLAPTRKGSKVHPMVNKQLVAYPHNEEQFTIKENII